MTTAAARDPELQSLLDRTAVTDVLCRYGSTIDTGDMTGLRAVFVDDARGRYGEAPWIEGADALVAWIAEAGRTRAWSQHLLSVYHVDVEGDRARALTYVQAHVVEAADPDTATLIVGRYHDELVRTAGGWRIATKRMEVLWRETHHAPPRR